MTAPTPDLSLPGHSSAWTNFLAASVAVAATYFYFLIFAEFAFLEYASASLNEAQMKPLMTALGAGGIAGSILAASRFSATRIRFHLTVGFAASAGVAAATLSSHAASSLIASAAGIGLSLGWGTVTLALSLLPSVGAFALGPVCGLGTGIAYAVCNQPAVFHASPSAQIGYAASAALIGLTATFILRPAASQAETEDPVRLNRWSRPRWVIAFFALVFLDSLAFYLIQHNAGARSGTWTTTATLQGNALVHFGAALLAGIALQRFRPAPTVLVALLLLVAACCLLSLPEPPFAVARSLYVAGVSVYSTALVFLPARSGRPWFAAAFMGISGWIGSAVALGLALEQAGRGISFWIPLLALAVGVAALFPLLAIKHRDVPSTSRFAALLVVAWMLSAFCPLPAHAEDAALIATGRRVYIAEGCIHCHSQYVRPGTPDELRWGPAHPMREVLTAEPPLLGNRRQGPDLANVGNRRTTEWNRLHLINPRAVSPGSRMPSYAYLFKAGDTRGDALLAYLASLGADTLPQRMETTARWEPAPNTQAAPQPQARQLFQQLCATCHGAEGHGDGAVAPNLSLRPPDFRQPAWRHFSSTPDDASLARLIKFGFPGTAMAGHETLDDASLLSLASYVKSLHAATVAP